MESQDLVDAAAPIIITPEALNVVKQALAEEGLEGHGLRVAVQGRGCSGLQYALDFDSESRDGDTVFAVDGLTVYLDATSAHYLQGTTIDYVSGLDGAGFQFNNPNEQGSCGCDCGSSCG